MKRKDYGREMDKLDAAHRKAMQRGDGEVAKMIGAEIAKLALQQHHGI